KNSRQQPLQPLRQPPKTAAVKLIAWPAFGRRWDARGVAAQPPHPRLDDGDVALEHSSPLIACRNPAVDPARDSKLALFAWKEIGRLAHGDRELEAADDTRRRSRELLDR